jgi:hypothetical protein
MPFAEYTDNDERCTCVSLFQRMLHLTGGVAAGAWAAEVTASVNKHSVSEVSLQRAAFGAPVGTIAWSAPVEALGQVNDLA